MEVVECELDVGDKAIPQVKRKGDMNRCKGGDNVILRRANVPFGKIRTVIIGGDKLSSYIYRRAGKIRPKGRGSFVVRDNVRGDVADRLKK